MPIPEYQPISRWFYSFLNSAVFTRWGDLLFIQRRLEILYDAPNLETDEYSIKALEYFFLKIKDSYKLSTTEHDVLFAAVLGIQKGKHEFSRYLADNGDLTDGKLPNSKVVLNFISTQASPESSIMSLDVFVGLLLRHPSTGVYMAKKSYPIIRRS